jgi:hypothetical protein
VATPPPVIALRSYPEKPMFFKEKLDGEPLPRSQNPVKAGPVSSATAIAAQSGLYWIFECGRCCLFWWLLLLRSFEVSDPFATLNG